MNDLIFGYTWEQIQSAQHGKPLSRPATATPQGDALLPGDVDLLTRHGLNGLEDMGYYGVIDRLSSAGLIDV